jgi:hypothetical protein
MMNAARWAGKRPASSRKKAAPKKPEGTMTIENE